jgi:alkylation response protein AidB-like acyl-CoA dehydrogenase
MALEINKGFLLALHLGRLKDAGRLQIEQISVGKLNNCREAMAICREAGTILGGNGITLDYSPLRHANNLESVRTYEVHTLVLGNNSEQSQRRGDSGRSIGMNPPAVRGCWDCVRRQDGGPAP